MVLLLFYQDCDCTLAHSSLRIAFKRLCSCTYLIPSFAHYFLFKGFIKCVVREGGYVMTTSPFMSGSAALGNPKGYVGFCHKNVEWILLLFTFQKLLLRLHPAASRGKNSRCARGNFPGTPACTKSPRMSNRFFAPKVCLNP
jgi:hypothetical protein